MTTRTITVEALAAALPSWIVGPRAAGEAARDIFAALPGATSTVGVRYSPSKSRATGTYPAEPADAGLREAFVDIVARNPRLPFAATVNLFDAAVAQARAALAATAVGEE